MVDPWSSGSDTVQMSIESFCLSIYSACPISVYSHLYSSIQILLLLGESAYVSSPTAALVALCLFGTTVDIPAQEVSAHHVVISEVQTAGGTAAEARYLYTELNDLLQQKQTTFF